jgi:hypothetical protein
MARSGRTGKRAASAASKTLRSKSASKTSKRAAASDLAQVGNRKVTGRKAASAAGKTLRSKSASKTARRAAASDLAQRQRSKRSSHASLPVDHSQWQRAGSPSRLLRAKRRRPDPIVEAPAMDEERACGVAIPSGWFGTRLRREAEASHPRSMRRLVRARDQIASRRRRPVVN